MQLFCVWAAGKWMTSLRQQLDVCTWVWRLEVSTVCLSQSFSILLFEIMFLTELRLIDSARLAGLQFPGTLLFLPPLQVLVLQMCVAVYFTFWPACSRNLLVFAPQVLGLQTCTTALSFWMCMLGICMQDSCVQQTLYWLNHHLRCVSVNLRTAILLVSGQRW